MPELSSRGAIGGLLAAFLLPSDYQ